MAALVVVADDQGHGRSAPVASDDWTSCGSSYGLRPLRRHTANLAAMVPEVLGKFREISGNFRRRTSAYD